MCGIVGHVSYDTTGTDLGVCSLLEEMLIVDTVRGKDSTGAFWKDRLKAQVMYQKDVVDGGTFVHTKLGDCAFLSVDWMVGHNRAATLGGVSEESAHPFAHKNLIGVHNGTIHGYKALWPGIEGVNDSDTLYAALNEVDATADAITEFLAQIHSGAYALVWFDHRTEKLHFVRNAQRPLHFVETEREGLFFASEGMMLKWLTERCLSIGKIGKVWSLATNTLMSIDTKDWSVETAAYTPDTAPLSNLGTRYNATSANQRALDEWGYNNETGEWSWNTSGV